MSIPILSNFQLNDMEVTYLVNQAGQVGLRAVPASLSHCVADNNEVSEPLVQLYITVVPAKNPAAIYETFIEENYKYL